MRKLSSILFFALLLTSGACAGKQSVNDHPLARFSSAIIVPGVGLGELKIGKTTLQWFVENIGSGSVSTLVADEAAIQLDFENGEASFLFIVRGKCQARTDAPRRRLEIGQDVRAFLSRFPECAELTLSSISVSAPRDSKKAGFFKGLTDSGVGLGSTRSDLNKLGNGINRPGQMVAGESDDGLERLEFPGGIYVYMNAGKGPTADEIASGKALSPERLAEIKKSADDASKTATVRKITVFAPE